MKNKKVIAALTVAALCASAPATAAFAQAGDLQGVPGQQTEIQQDAEGEQLNGQKQEKSSEGQQMNGEQAPMEKPEGEQAPAQNMEGEQAPTQNMEGQQPGGEQQVRPAENNQQAKPTENLKAQIKTLIDKLTQYLKQMEADYEENKANLEEKPVPKFLKETGETVEKIGEQAQAAKQDGKQKFMNAFERFLGIAEDDQQPGQQMQNAEGQQPSGEQQNMQGQPGGMNGEQSAPTSFEAASQPDADSTGETYTSEKDGENAVLVSGKTVTLSDSTVTKTGDASDENADFYGTNAAVLANNGANLTVAGANISTNGTHANAVFSNGSGTSVSISDSTIKTTGNNSGGIMVTGGGSIDATNLKVETSGNSSAAIRSDRGGGTANVSEGTYATSGVGSPAIYSTADISVKNATLSATSSEAVVIEGGNSVTLADSDISGNNSKLNGQSTIPTNVLIYQSMSGDAQEGSSTFTMNGGTLTSGTGAMFHVTNVTTTIDLTNVTMKYASDSDDFLIASADSWGSTGKNGGNVTLNLHSQTIEGNITVDKISTLDMTIDGKSSYTGAINSDGTAGDVHVIMESGATWTLTGDSYITSFDGDYSAVDLNGYKLFVNGVQITK